MIKKVVWSVLSVGLALCLACCVYLFFFDKGKNGTDGRDGADGKDGSRWYMQEGTPPSELGDPGDCYLDVESGSLYQKTQDVWGFLGTLDRGGTAAKQVTVTFEPNGGTLDEGEDRQTVESGNSLRLPIPQWEGYEFLGWFLKESENRTPLADLTVFTEDVTLVAEWRKKTTITLDMADPEGGSVTFSGRYDGTPLTLLLLLIERDGEQKTIAAAEKAGWVYGDDVDKNADETGAFRGMIGFIEAGTYRLIFRFMENGRITELIREVQIEL